MVYGKIISINLQLRVDRFDSKWVELWFRRPNDTKSLTCAYWNETDEQWQQNGVTKFFENQTHYGCRTSHLTNFATVYFLYDGPSTDTVGLQVLTYTVCPISLVSLLLIILYQFFVKWQNDVTRRKLFVNRNVKHKCKTSACKAQVCKTANTWSNDHTISNLKMSREHKSKNWIFMINLSIALMGSLSSILALCAIPNQVHKTNFLRIH